MGGGWDRTAELLVVTTMETSDTHVLVPRMDTSVGPVGQTSPVTPRRVLVITGAGASRSLGRDSQVMPLMTDWANSLCTDLDQAEEGLADAIGLFPDLPGDKFEDFLGHFLALRAFSPQLKRLGRLGAEGLRAGNDWMGAWHPNFTRRSAEAVEVIHRNLYENFGHRRLSEVACSAAYMRVRQWFTAADGSTHLWFATTNYDPAIEVAFEHQGFQILDGFTASSRYASERLEPLGLTDTALQSNSYLPLLHLHGAVGWYRDSDGSIRRYAADLPYNPTLGTPALLLPDSTKTINSLAGGEQLWVEFRRLLEEASHVVFLGHSLHDQHLVELVAEASTPTAVLS